MTIDTTRILKAALAALTLGIFAIAVAAPVTLDGGKFVEKSAYAAKGKGSEGTGEANNDADDGTPDQGGGNDDDAPDEPDAPDAPDGADDDGTPDQGPGDN